MMNTCLILLVLAAVCLIGAKDNDKWSSVFLFLLVQSIVSLIFFILTEFHEKPQEFPSERYSMEVKTIAYNDKIDTTYVIVPKPKK